MCCLFLCGRSDMDLRTKQACEIYVTLTMEWSQPTCDPFKALKPGLISNYLPTPLHMVGDTEGSPDWLGLALKGNPLLKREAARNRPWRTLAFLPLLTSSLLTKNGIIYTQLLHEEKIVPMMSRSEWLTEWSLRYTHKCSKSWVKNSDQNFLPLHLAAPC